MRDNKTIAVLTLGVGAAIVSVMAIATIIATSYGAAMLVLGLGIYAVSKDLIARPFRPLFILVLTGLLTHIYLVS